MKTVLDRIVVKLIKAPEVSKGGIYLPNRSEENEMIPRAKVLEVGPGRVDNNGKKIEMNVKVGDTVMFQKSIAVYIKVEAEDYYIIRDSDILIIL